MTVYTQCINIRIGKTGMHNVKEKMERFFFRINDNEFEKVWSY